MGKERLNLKSRTDNNAEINKESREINTGKNKKHSKKRKFARLFAIFTVVMHIFIFASLYQACATNGKNQQDSTTNMTDNIGKEPSKTLRERWDDDMRRAKRGDVDAMEDVADNYYEGDDGYRLDLGRALYWYRKAAEKGHVECMIRVGKMYENGEGCERNLQEAKKWYQKAVNSGYISAQKFIDNLVSIENNSDNLKISTESMPTTTRREDRDDDMRRAKKGDVDAMEDVADNYYEGDDGYRKDKSRALYWYKIAAEKGDVESMMKLARMYANGEGCAKNTEESAKWYRKASQSGHKID